MARFYGKVGYGKSDETVPGVWKKAFTEVNYSGEVLRNIKQWRAGESLNDDLTVNNVISIVADPFAYDNIGNIQYIEWMGSKWKVTNVDIQRPRLILTLGGIYNG